MANKIMYRSHAEDYLARNGWKLFLDMIIKDKIIVMEREIKAVFTTNEYCKSGTISLELWPEGLVLWVGGEIRWKEWEK